MRSDPVQDYPVKGEALSVRKGIATQDSLRKRGRLSLHLMIFPAIVLLLVFSYGPMLGLVMAFQKFVPAKGFFNSEWVGWANFEYIFKLPGFWNAVRNTLFISIVEIVIGQVLAIVVALFINEAKRNWYTKSVQTIIYLPHFLSWVIVGGIFLDLLGMDGLVNRLLQAIGINPVYFMGNSKIFPWVLIITHLWKEVGFATIVYLAALVGVDQGLYEAAEIDGASRLKRIWYITLPSILPTILLVAVLNMGSIMSVSADQVMVMYNPLVYSTGDIIDSFVFRMGVKQSQYSVAAAAGIFKSVVSLIFISTANYAANRFANHRIF